MELTRRLKVASALAVVLLATGCGGSSPNPAFTDGVSADRLGLDDWLVIRLDLSPDLDYLVVSGVTDAPGFGVSRGGKLSFFQGPLGSTPDVAWIPDRDLILVAEGSDRTDLASGRGSTFSIMGPDGVLAGTIELDGPLVVAGGMSVSSDGLRAVVAAFGEATDRMADLFSIDLESGHVTRLTDTPDINETSPSLLADGSIVYAAGPPQFDLADPGRVVVREADGTTRRLTDDDMLAAGVAASDSGRVVFLGRPTDSEVFELTLWLTATEGGEPEQIARGVTEPWISPDGSTVAALSILDESLVILHP